MVSSLDHQRKESNFTVLGLQQQHAVSKGGQRASTAHVRCKYDTMVLDFINKKL